jgi:hopanoid biosynthesis associated RND transporter like protein HpnN
VYEKRLENLVGGVIARWVAFVARHAVITLAVMALGSSVIAWYTATHLGVNADLNEMFSDKLRYRMLETELQKFPALVENVLIIIDGETPELARSAASRLAARLEDEPNLFESVYVPRGDFFDDHALLYRDTDELEDFADRLARMQPYLAGLAKDGTVRGLGNLLERGVAAAREGDVSGEELVPMLDQFDLAVRAWLEGRHHVASWAEIVAGHPLDVEARRRFILAKPVLDLGDMNAAQRPLDAVRSATDELGLVAANGVRVRMTGDLALSYDEMRLVREQAITAGIVSFVLVAAILMFALRSVWLVVATLLTLVLGLLWTAGFAALAIGHLNPISVAFAVLFIGLSVDFGIHLCLRYQEIRALPSLHDAALAEAMRSVGTSIALCAITTAIGFYAFVPTDFAGVAELGLISGSGMFISLFWSFTGLPALLTVGKRWTQGQRPQATAAMTHAVLSFPARHPWLVACAAAIVAGATALLMPHVYFDQNPLRVRDPAAESVRAFEELLADGGTSPWDLSVLATDLTAAERIARRLRELPEVERAITLTDYVPADQQAKLAIIEDVALFLAPVGPGDEASPPSTRQQLQALAGLRDELAGLVRDGAKPALEQRALRLYGDLGKLLSRANASVAESEDAVRSLRDSLLASLPDQLDMLQRAVRTGPITLDKLPAGLRERMIADDGRVRVEIVPSDDLTDNAALDRFVAAVRTVAPDAAGSAVYIHDASRAAVAALREALVSAVVVIALLLFVIWRTVGDTALVMTPLALAATMTAGATVVLGIPFNFADVIVLPLLLGIGVDSGIHLVERARLSGIGAANLLESSTARAVLYSSLTTIASFGTLGLARHRGMASMGLLLTVGIGLAVIANLVVLPALIELRAQGQAR